MNHDYFLSLFSHFLHQILIYNHLIFQQYFSIELYEWITTLFYIKNDKNIKFNGLYKFYSLTKYIIIWLIYIFIICCS